MMSSIERLARTDLELDVILSYESYEGVYAVARRFPELRIVLNHIAEGRPIDGGPPNPRWVEAMQRAGELPNVYCKVSALVQMTEESPAPSEVEFYAPALDVLWEAFGRDRLVYGSNWPNMEIGAPYATQLRIVESYFAGKGEEATERFFWKNAMAAYRWVERP
jgi:L-fuconolactonase